MSLIIKKILNRLGIKFSLVTEKIDGFKTTYEPFTDIGQKLYWGKSFEREEINIAAGYIKSNSVVLDIGANIGLHALKFSALANEGLVIACEPQPKTFNLLMQNISQNNISNIIPLNIALARTSEITDFFIMKDDAYSSLIDTGRKEISEKVKVLCTTIDGLLGNVKVDFVKIDVEGLELNVLKSMEKLVRSFHPVIFCEIYKGKIAENNPADTILFLRNLGYKVFRVIDGILVEFKQNESHDDELYNYFFVYQR